MQVVFLLCMAGAIPYPTPDFRRRVLPGKQLQVPALQGAKIAAAQLRVMQVIAARAEGDDALDRRHLQGLIDP